MDSRLSSYLGFLITTLLTVTCCIRLSRKTEYISIKVNVYEYIDVLIVSTFFTYTCPVTYEKLIRPLCSMSSFSLLMDDVCAVN